MSWLDNYPFSNFHELNLDWVLTTLRDMYEQWEATKTEWASYKEFIDNYFKNLDVQNEIDNKINALVEDGTMGRLLLDVIGGSSQPQFVSSVEQMTDPTRNYVLRPSGRIYIYNGTQFIDSGITYGSGAEGVTSFNRIISPSTMDTMPFTTFDDCVPNTIYAYTSGAVGYIGGLPSAAYGSNGVLIDARYNQNYESGRVQLLYTFDTRLSYYRVRWSDSVGWSEWTSFTPSTRMYITGNTDINFNNITDAPNNVAIAISGDVAAEKITGLPVYGKPGVYYSANINQNSGEDFNGSVEFFMSGFRLFQRMKFGDGTFTWNECESMLPVNIFSDNLQGFTSYDNLPNGEVAIVDTNNVLQNRPRNSFQGIVETHQNGTAGYQVARCNTENDTQNGRVYVRFKWAGAWREWQNNDQINGYNFYSNTVISALGLPDDLDNYNFQSIIAVGEGITEEYLKNLPLYGEAGILLTLTHSPVVSNGMIQIFATTRNNIWVRVKYSQYWRDWIGLTETGSNYFISTCIDRPFNLNANSTIIAFGDSITAGYNVGAQNVWVYLLARKIGCSLINKAVSGSRFDEEATNIIKTQYESVTDEQWNNCTHVIIAGGVNDATNSTPFDRFRTSVQNAIDYIKTHAPNAKILFITPIERNSTIYNTIRYASIINSLGLLADCSIVNGYDVPIPFRNSPYYTNLTSDGIHPNIQGQKVYAQYMSSILL